MNKWSPWKRLVEHLISVHGCTPSEARTFDHAESHRVENWDHNEDDLSTQD